MTIPNYIETFYLTIEDAQNALSDAEFQLTQAEDDYTKGWEDWEIADRIDKFRDNVTLAQSELDKLHKVDELIWQLISDSLGKITPVKSDEIVRFN